MDGKSPKIVKPFQLVGSADRLRTCKSSGVLTVQMNCLNILMSRKFVVVFKTTTLLTIPLRLLIRKLE